MADHQGVDGLEPTALQALLVRHKSHLTTMCAEVTSLKSVIKALEESNEGLRHEVSSLKLELRHYKDNSQALARQLGDSDSAADTLTLAMQKQNQDHSHIVSELESNIRRIVSENKLKYDRLGAQLEATQQPNSSTQPLPWRRIAPVLDHPVHILREVILDDQRREERILQRNLPILAGDNTFSASDPLLRLTSSDIGCASGSDDASWLLVVKRVFVVLKERRASLGVSNADAPTDFFVRSRNMMVGEWVQLHREVGKALRVLTSLRRASPDGAQRSGGMFFERQIDHASSILADVDTQCHRVEQTCFTDIDRILYTTHLGECQK